MSLNQILIFHKLMNLKSKHSIYNIVQKGLFYHKKEHAIILFYYLIIIIIIKNKKLMHN